MSDDYRESCPHCGGPLSRVDKGGDHAPWVCANCRLAFWNAELTDTARAAWRPDHHDFGFGDPAAVIHAARDLEHTTQQEG